MWTTTWTKEYNYPSERPTQDPGGSMARHPRNDMAAKELHLHLKRLAKQRPATAKDIELETYARSNVRVGQETIRKALAGEVDPTQCNVEVLSAFTAFYGVTPDKLGKFAERRLHDYFTLAGVVPGGGPDQGTAASRCTEQSRAA